MLFTLPKVYVAASDGSPLMGARLWFYATGTSTPLDTYSDEGRTTANANPMIADAYGVFGPAWLSDALYRVTLTDAGGTTRWTVDGVGQEPYADALTGISVGVRGTSHAYDALAVDGDGVMTLGDGDSAADVSVSRTAADVLSLGSGDSLALDGTWNGGTLRLGSYWLWVDQNGVLRIKNGAPTSAEDGTVVGVQIAPPRMTRGNLAITGYAPTVGIA